MGRIRLSVVIPAYNEERNLKNGVLEEVSNYLKSVDYLYEIIIVDDGSKDQTVPFIKEFIKNRPAFCLIENDHGGKAISVMTGLLEARGEIAAFTDMDQATPLNQIEKILPKFEEGFDIVIGSRHDRKGAPPIRKLVSWGFTVLRNIILGLPYEDTNCGFKAFNQIAIQEVFPSLLVEWKRRRASKSAVNAGFDIEMLYIAKKRGLKVATVGVDWHYVGTERVQVVRDALETIKDMLRIRIQDLQGRY